MKKILSFFMTFLVLAFIVQSCGRDGDTPAVPTDETKDRGHEMPNKIELIMTDLSTNQQHKKVGVLTPNGVVYDDETPFVWKAGGKYHFEIVYFVNGRRINSEFVSKEMAPIHQHFFEMFQGEYQTSENKRKEQAKAMDRVVTYEYQDTDPENKSLKDGASIRLRTWDTDDPTEIDPIGLKGVFSVKTDVETQDYKMLVRLAHFLRKNKLQDNGKVRKYNEIPTIVMVPDIAMTLPIRIEK